MTVNICMWFLQIFNNRYFTCMFGINAYIHFFNYLCVAICVLLVALWNSGGGAVETGNGSLAAGCFFWMQVVGVEYWTKTDPKRVLFLCFVDVQPYLEWWSCSSRSSACFLSNGWFMGRAWWKHSWNKRTLNGFLCSSVFGSMFVKIYCWLFECPLVGLCWGQRAPHSLWRSCTSTDAGNVSHTAKTSGVPMLALRNRSCKPALRRTKSCRTWDWMLHMLFPVALCGLV